MKSSLENVTEKRGKLLQSVDDLLIGLEPWSNPGAGSLQPMKKSNPVPRALI